MGLIGRSPVLGDRAQPDDLIGLDPTGLRLVRPRANDPRKRLSPANAESVRVLQSPFAVPHPSSPIHTNDVTTPGLALRPSTWSAIFAAILATGCSAPPPDLAPDPGSASETSSAPPPTTCPALTRGWTPYKASRTIQFENAGPNDKYCTYRDSGGVEFFRMTKNPAGGVQRCEARMNNDYTSGSNQFEGDVLVTAGDLTSIHQVFKFLMIVAFPQHGGELHQHSNYFLESGVFGKWIHVTTIHDTHTHLADVYLNCVHKYRGHDEPEPSSSGWYDKYGLYGIDGIAPLQPYSQVEWKNVRTYRRP
jgi:hypothetical protein